MNSTSICLPIYGTQTNQAHKWEGVEEVLSFLHDVVADLSILYYPTARSI